MAKTEADIKRAWEERWPVGFKPVAEKIVAAAPTCDAKVGLDRMACYAVVAHSKKAEEKKTAEGIINKGLAKARGGK